MFCEKCGTPNNDNNAVCTNCGAPLRHLPLDGGYPQQGQQAAYQPPQSYAQPPQQYPQQQPYPQQNGAAPYYPPQPGYGAPAGRKPTALYIVAGVLAALQFFMVFLPHVSSYGHSYNFFGIVSEVFGASRTTSYYNYNANAGNALNAGIVFLLLLFIVPMALQIVWAILSFMQKRPAGIFGVIASSVYFVSSVIWLAVLAAATNANAVTAVPVLMIFLAIAGIPVAIVQIVKKKYL